MTCLGASLSVIQIPSIGTCNVALLNNKSFGGGPTIGPDIKHFTEIVQYKLTN